MKRKHFLALADGSVFYGVPCGAPCDALGEAVFNTGHTGYQEIVSDPSYAGQTVVLSAPEIGNYGCTPLDMESRSLFLSGLIVRQMNEPSNWRSRESFRELLCRFGKPALSDVDTRALVLHLRRTGSQRSFLHAGDEPVTPEEGVARARQFAGLDGIDMTSRVTDPNGSYWEARSSFPREPERKEETAMFFDKEAPLLAAFDFGIKRSILRSLSAAGFRIRVVPAGTNAGEILALKPDGLFLSNGPGDPAGVRGGIETVRSLLGKLPIMGICLGHQILATACGAQTGRLKFGHHGCNHPVKNLLDDTVAITSQNHNFAVVKDSLPRELELTHVNLNDGTVEGIRHQKARAFSVQFHPEAAPGPHDAANLFRRFREMF